MRRGFTLIEILVVVAIMGIAMMVVMPNIGALGSTQASIAAQDAIQLVKYARNMAVLNQTPVDVNFGANGDLSVIAQELVSVSTIASNVEIDDTEVDDDDISSGVGQEPATKKVQEGVISEGFEDISIVKTHQGVGYTFIEFLDTFEDEIAKRKNTGFRSKKIASSDDEDALTSDENDLTAGNGGESAGYTITMKSNGTCRPFSIRIHSVDSPEGGTIIHFDLLGTGKVQARE